MTRRYKIHRIILTMVAVCVIGAAPVRVYAMPSWPDIIGNIAGHVYNQATLLMQSLRKILTTQVMTKSVGLLLDNALGNRITGTAQWEQVLFVDTEEKAKRKVGETLAILTRPQVVETGATTSSPSGSAAGRAAQTALQNAANTGGAFSWGSGGVKDFSDSPTVGVDGKLDAFGQPGFLTMTPYAALFADPTKTFMAGPIAVRMVEDQTERERMTLFATGTLPQYGTVDGLSQEARNLRESYDSTVLGLMTALPSESPELALSVYTSAIATAIQDSATRSTSNQINLAAEQAQAAIRQEMQVADRPSF